MVQIWCTKAAIAFWFPFAYFCLKDSNDELILIVSGTLLQILGAIYETVSVPYLFYDSWNNVLYDFQDRNCLRCFYGKRYLENWGTVHLRIYKFL